MVITYIPHYKGDIRKDFFRGGGCVIIITCGCLHIEQQDIEGGAENIWVSLKICYLQVFYRHPGGSADAQMEKFMELKETLEHVMTRSNQSSTVIVGGDFNLQDIDWSTNTVKHNNTNKKVIEHVLNIFEDVDLIQVQKDPTGKHHILDFCGQINSE